MTTKLTKQGVLDLNHLRGKSRGRKIELPETMLEPCKHRDTEEYRGELHCIECGNTFPIRREAS